MKEVLLIKFSGADQKGLTAQITGVLAKYDVTILDIGQSVIHANLTWGILIQLPESIDSSAVVKDVLFKSHELGLHIEFEPVSIESYNQWVAEQGKPKHIITLLAHKLTAVHLARLSEVVTRHSLNIDRIERLSGRLSLDSHQIKPSTACVELSVRGAVISANQVRADFLEIASEMDIDIAYQEDTVFRRNRRLVAFDMDSTLIEAEVIVELAKAAGVGEQVEAITESAMRGELDFNESFKARMALLKGLDESVLEGIAERLVLSEGAERLVSFVKKMGYKTAILSGGFDYFGRFLQRKLGIDYVYANELDIVDSKVTGEVKGTIVNGERKAELLREIAKEENISLEQVIAVGDGANDLPMLSIAGLGIAFRAKPLVKESAQHAISTFGLDGILYLLGYSDRETSQ